MLVICSELFNRTKAVPISRKLSFAVERRDRRRGLIGVEEMKSDEAYVFPGCRQIHTFGMRFPIDVVFLDRSFKVVRIYPELKPGSITGIAFRWGTVIELKGGVCTKTNTTKGDILELR